MVGAVGVLSGGRVGRRSNYDAGEGWFGSIYSVKDSILVRESCNMREIENILT